MLFGPICIGNTIHYNFRTNFLRTTINCFFKLIFILILYIDYGFWINFHLITRHYAFSTNFHLNTIDYAFWTNFHPNTIDNGFWTNFQLNTIDYVFFY